MYVAADTKRRSAELLNLGQTELVEIKCASTEETNQVYSRLNTQRFRLKIKGIKLRFSRPECWVRILPLDMVMPENQDIPSVSENPDIEVQDEQVAGDGETDSSPVVPGLDAGGSKAPRRRRAPKEVLRAEGDEAPAERTDDDDGAGSGGVRDDVLVENGTFMTAEEYHAVGRKPAPQKKVEPATGSLPADNLYSSAMCKERGKCFACGNELLRAEPGYNMDHYHSKRFSSPAVVDVCCVCVGHHYEAAH